MAAPLDATDRELLRLLQADGSLSNVELARRVELTPAPTLERVRRLEAEGYIRRYVALADQRLLGKPVTAFVSVILKWHRLDTSIQFRKAVAALPEVLECHHIAGDEDFLLKVVAASPEEYEEFVLQKLTKVKGIEKVKTTFVLSSSKVETAIPVMKPPEERTGRRARQGAPSDSLRGAPRGARGGTVRSGAPEARAPQRPPRRDK